ncbi:cytidylate kinase-like family protein [Megamonas funiformis]|uniref:cytidylate kinase-like family protein n=1 Tax=Megamonas funiformis TaxID=437897 RepID=UPI0035667E6B
MNSNTVITISRQYGCGGRELAEILAKKLNVKLYDRQIVHIAAAKLGINDLSEQDLLDLENTVHPLTLTFMPFHSFGTRMGESSRGMFLSEASVVRKLANDGPCVILGRCADYVLEDMPNHFSIFVCANDEYREKRGKEVYEGKTLKELDVENEKRARYYNYYTGKKWGEASNYDLIVNTSNAPLDKIADAIIEYINTVK